MVQLAPHLWQRKGMHAVQGTWEVSRWRSSTTRMTSIPTEDRCLGPTFFETFYIGDRNFFGFLQNRWKKGVLIGLFSRKRANHQQHPTTSSSVQKKWVLDPESAPPSWWLKIDPFSPPSVGSSKVPLLVWSMSHCSECVHPIITHWYLVFIVFLARS